MASLLDQVPPEKEAAYYQKLIELLESFLQSGREALKSYPKDHPKAVFMQAYVSRYEAVLRGESSLVLAEELTELGKILTSAGVLKGQGAPKPENYPGIVGDLMVESGFSWQQTERIMNYAKKPEGGAPLADTAMQALVMEVVEHKSRTEIASTLCHVQHRHDNHCLDRFGHQINKLKKLLTKYAVSTR